MALRHPGDFPVYFARHGETLFNTQRRWQGRRDDSPLTARGLAHAGETGAILKDLVFPAGAPQFVASPLGRARTTMEIVLERLDLPTDGYTTDERLAEIDLGEWAGLVGHEVEKTDRLRFEARERDKWNVPVPGGESYAMVAVRITDWFTKLNRETVVIAHGGVGRILRGLYAGLAWQEISALDEPYGTAFRLQSGIVTRFDTPPSLPQV